MRYLTGALLLILLFTACAPTPPEESPTSSPVPTVPADLPQGAAREFSTDFSQHSVPYEQILSGGVPKDGIPAIDAPQFISIEEADEWLEPEEPVILVEQGGQARAYPIQILIWHEIVNDEIGGVPVVVTYCPLCNTAIAFERTVEGEVLDFGTTGRLRYSNLIMYDRQTESWWQQGTGEAIAGEHTSAKLPFLPAFIIGWETFKESYPEGRVLSRETGHSRSYGSNPYPGYDDVNSAPFLYEGPETPGVLPPKARVLAVGMEGEAPAAYPYTLFEELRVANDSVDEEPIVVFWSPETASPLDSRDLSEGREVGALLAFSRRVGGDTLTFAYENGQIVDEETGTVWDSLGVAQEGPLAGEDLEPVAAANYLWFALAAFKPEAEVFQALDRS